MSNITIYIIILVSIISYVTTLKNFEFDKNILVTAQLTDLVLDIERLATTCRVGLLIQVVQLHVALVTRPDVRLEQVPLRVALAAGAAVVGALS